MNTDQDVSQYLPIFTADFDENVEGIESALVELERQGHNQELLNRVFRGAHTIKGAAATMGFEGIATLTHDMENILDRLRQGSLEMTREITDLLFRCLDTLKELRAGLFSFPAGGKVNLAGLRRDLERVCAAQAGSTGEKVRQPNAGIQAGADPPGKPGLVSSNNKSPVVQLDDVELNVFRTAEIKGYHTYFLKVTLDNCCQMKGARAYIVFHNLKDCGEVIKAIPPVEDIEAEEFGDSFSLVLISMEDTDTIVSIVKSTSEIAGVELSVISSGDSESTARSNREPSPGNGGTSSATGGTQTGREVQRKSGQTVRVDVRRLENLMNLVGELVIDRTRLTEVALKFRRGQGLGTDDNQAWELLEEVSGHIGRVTGELQEEIMKARMFPIEQVFNRFPRLVRDLAQKAGKEIELIIEGQETELDRTVIEEIGDPLIHLLRNAVDHGIESPEERLRTGKPPRGQVRLAAQHRENQIVITVEDDGRGMDPAFLRRQAVARGLLEDSAAKRLSEREALGLIFRPGFSTAGQVSDVSGRGVGMDIVRSHVEKINGAIDLQTVPGKGTTFTIRLPLTLAINRSLLVSSAGNLLAIPLANVVEILGLASTALQTVRGQEVILLRGQALSIVSLAEILALGTEGAPARDGSYRAENGGWPANLNIVVVGLEDRRIGLVVDALIGEQEIVIKSLGEYISYVPGIAGATIMGNGRVALILDMRGLFHGSELGGTLWAGRHELAL